MMKKKYAVMTICLSACMILSGCQKTGQKKKETSVSQPQATQMAETSYDEMEVKEELNASALEVLSIDYAEKITSKEIFSKTKAGKKMTTAMIQTIKDSAKAEADDPNVAHDSHYLGAEKGYYLCKKSVRFWDAFNNEMDNSSVYFVVFSKDLKKSALVSASIQENSLTDIQYSRESGFVDIMRKNPTEKYIAMYNGTIATLLDEKNQLHDYQQDAQAEVSVKGDYYQALDAGKIAVSYKELTDPANLLWIEK